MAVQTRRVTVEEFEHFIQQPEHADRLFEHIGGEIVEVVSNNYSSAVAARIIYWLTHYLMQHPIGRVTGADGGYIVSGERYIPDVGFVRKDRQPEPSHAAYNPNAPDLAVEVLSPTNDPDMMRFKLVTYLAAGTVVWIVNPEKKQVEVYAPGHPPQKIGLGGSLDGGDVLPGFALAVKDIFPE